MFYVNSETILNIDLFLSLYRGELSTIINKIIYQLPTNIFLISEFEIPSKLTYARHEISDTISSHNKMQSS